MHRLPRPWFLRVLAAVAIGLVTPGPSPAAPETPEPAPPPAAAPTAEPREDDAPVYLFLNAPADLDAFWKSLTQPDFVLMKGDDLRKRLDRARAGTATPLPGRAIVGAVAVEGKAAGELADVTVDFEILLGDPGPTWVPIRLDDQTVTDARADDRDLPLKVADGGGWLVELGGAGPHRVRVRLKVPLRATADGHRLDFAIPEAASTRFRLDVARRVAEASAGGGDPVDLEPIEGGSQTRLSAHLSPRPRLDLRWTPEAEPGAQLPPLLSMQGEIAIDIDPGSFRTRSSWAIHSVRGTSRTLELRLGPDDEVLELELDGQTVPAGIERDDGTTRMTIPLAEPLRPGPPRRLVMTTKRTIPAQSSARLTFHGFPLTSSREQSGAIGIAQSGNLWISGTAGRGVRRIDPRTELPADLRTRPTTVLGYHFVDQPFELALRVDRSPPLVSTEARTTVTLDAGGARVETRFDYRAAHGRLFDLTVGLPRGMMLESVGPRDVVETFSEVPDDAPSPGVGARLLKVRLTPKALEGGTFALHLVGRQAIDPARPVAVGLFQPRDAVSEGGRVAVLTDRNLTVDLAGATDGTGGSEVFRAALQDPPADWPWPADRSGSGPAALWLRHDDDPPALPLRVTVHPKALAHATRLLAQVGRSEVEIRQETDCTVHFGTLDHVDVDIPAAIQGRWELEEGDVTAREDLGPTTQGGRRHRLRLAESVADKVLLKFRIHHRPTTPLEPDHAAEVEIPWLRVVEGTAAPMQVEVASEPGVLVEGRATGWTIAEGEQPAAHGAEEGPLVRFTLIGPEAEDTPPRVVATARTLTTLPPLLASRLWLRTIQGPEGDLRTSARYWVETHASTLSVALPPGAEWVRARLGGEPVEKVESLPRSSGYRLRFPPRSATGAVLVEIEYLVPARSSAPEWAPPKLLDGGLIQQTLWEVRVPWSRAVVGVPPGWTDENSWYWDRYVWKRRPRRMAATPPTGTGGAIAEPDDDGRGGSHAYLFGRPGEPAGLPLTIASRARLVGLCSGPVLALGVLILLLRPPFRLVGPALLALALAVATAVDPSVTLLAVQSSTIGVAFTLLAVAMQRLVERHRPSAAVFGEPARVTITPAGSTVSRTVGVGSDDPTEVRVKPVSSTVDHVSKGPPAPSEGPEKRK